MILPSAFFAGPVAGGKGRRFIQEEKLGPAPGCHDLPMAALERQHTGDPGNKPVWPHDLLPIIVDDPTITHPCATGRRPDDISKWIDSIL